jgi:hypothetical protein
LRIACSSPAAAEPGRARLAHDITDLLALAGHLDSAGAQMVEKLADGEARHRMDPNAS